MEMYVVLVNMWHYCISGARRDEPIPPSGKPPQKGCLQEQQDAFSRQVRASECRRAHEITTHKFPPIRPCAHKPRDIRGA